jgi:hypothetical protein
MRIPPAIVYFPIPVPFSAKSHLSEEISGKYAVLVSFDRWALKFAFLWHYDAQEFATPTAPIILPDSAVIFT